MSVRMRIPRRSRAAFGAAVAALFLQGCADIGAGSMGLGAGSIDITLPPPPPGAGAEALLLSSTGSSFQIGTCVAVTVTAVDSTPAAAAVDADTLVSLSDDSPGSFYSDAGCGSGTSDVTILNGQSSADVWFRQNGVGGVTLTGSATGLNPDDLALSFSAPPATQLTIEGAAAITTVDCAAYTVTSRDSGGTPRAVSSDTDVALTGAGAGGSYYSDSGCSTSATEATILNGQSSALAYYRKSSIGSVTLAADAPPLTADTLDVTVNAAPPVKLDVTGASSATTVDCTALTVTTLDALNAPANVAANTNVSFAGAGPGGLFYSDSGCSTISGSASVAAGTSSGVLYYRQTAPDTLLFTANAPGLTDDTHALTITQAPPDRLTIEGPSAISTTQCATYTITTRDSSLLAAGVTGDTTVTLGGVGTNGSFYSNSGCSSAITETVFTTGTSVRNVYYRQTTPPAPITLTVTATGLLGNFVNVSLNGGAATVLRLTSPQSTYTTIDCVLLTVSTEDASSNTVAVSANTTINLATSNGGTFYSNNTCATTITSTSITSGSSFRDFYYKKTTTPGAVNLTASATAKVPSTLPLTVNPATPVKLAWSTGGTPVASNACTTYTISAQDVNNNNSPVAGITAVTVLDGGAGGAFYSSVANCNASTGATSSFNIAAAAASVSAIYKKSSQAAVTFTADASGFTLGTKNVTVSTAVPNKFFSSSGATTGIVNGCYSQVVILRDEQNLTANAPANITMNLADASDGSFYSNSSCTTLITNLVYSTGQNSKTFYYRKPSTGVVTRTYSDAAVVLASATRAMNVSSGVITKVSFSTAPTSTPKNVCTAYAVRTRDENNQTVNTVAARDVDLGGVGDGAFYPANTCAGGAEIVLTTILAGTSTRTIYYKKPTSGAVVLSAASSGITSGTANVKVTNVATELRYTSGTTTPGLNTCEAYVIRSTDNVGTPVNVTSNKTVTLGGPFGGASFYLDPDCSYPITNTTITNGTSTATVYLSSPDAGATTLTATTAGFGTGTLDLTFGP
ncbi:MAG: hypothetical protein IT285_12115 [Bdellovibrionales bacterium]|nr:hypothetical protein [Bdellovibrionales bacterium]